MEKRVRKLWAGLLRFAFSVFTDFQRNRCLEKASSLGFQTILSIVPTLVLSLFLLRSLGSSGALGGDVTRVILHQLNVDRIILTVPASGTTPAATFRLGDKLQEIIADVDGALRSDRAGLASFFGIVVAAVFMALEIEYSMNSIWNAESPGGLLRRVCVSLSLMAVLPLFIGLAVDAGRLFPAAAFLDRPVGVVIPFLVFYALYRFVPAARVENRPALIGAAFAAVAWHAAKIAFGLYLLTAVGYGTLYGILGLLPIFTAWIWLGWTIVLAGAEAAYIAQNFWRPAAPRRRGGG
jgi:membrane protein